MEIIIFTLNGIFLYLFSGWILRVIEARRGSPVPYQQALFFVIFLSLALISFRLLRLFLAN